MWCERWLFDQNNLSITILGGYKIIIKMTVTIDLAKKEMVSRIAGIHIKEIGQGFMSQLGVGFLRLFYEAIVASKDSFVVVALENGDPVGFMAGSVNMSATKKFFYKKYFIPVIFSLLPKLGSPKTVKKLLETSRYAGKESSSQFVPEAEIIAMAVSACWCRQGIATQMFSRFVEEMRIRNISSFRTLVGLNLEKAIKFYEALGFIFHSETVLHGGERSRLYVYELR